MESQGQDSNSGGSGDRDRDGHQSTKKQRLEPKTEPDQKKPLANNQSSKCYWQESKGSIKERTSCLVNSERLSDVTFHVGPMETPIFGHKTILSAGSPYFEALFFGPMAIKGNVNKIPDMEPEVFLSFLKYLYTDEFDETMDASDALLLLVPAKEYIVPHLANKCADLLINAMSPENVFFIYEKAILFDEHKLADVCLRYLDRQIDKVIVTEQFLEIRLDILCTVLQRENLRINECVLFKAVLRWADAECKRQDLEQTPSNQREVIGKGIQLIRFPAMSREEFAIEVVPSGVLTKDEIISVFMNLCIGNDQTQYRPETPFVTDRRVYRPKLHYLTRFADVLSKVIHFNSLYAGDNVYNSSVKFTTDQRVFINGIGIYALSSSISGLKFNATVSLFKSRSVPNPTDVGPGTSSLTFAFGQLLGTRSMEGNTRNYDFRMPFQVMFDRPLEVRPNEEYSLNAILKIVRDSTMSACSNAFATFGSGHSGFGGYGNQIDAYYGTKSMATVYTPCTDGIKVVFTFPAVISGESFTTGQIPQIIFSV